MMSTYIGALSFSFPSNGDVLSMYTKPCSFSSLSSPHLLLSPPSLPHVLIFSSFSSRCDQREQIFESIHQDSRVSLPPHGPRHHYSSLQYCCTIQLITKQCAQEYVQDKPSLLLSSPSKFYIQSGPTFLLWLCRGYWYPFLLNF